MKRKYTITAIFLLQLIAHCTLAQNNELKFNLVEGPGGKPLGKINAMSQDPHGFMWLAGSGARCLYRYDGNKITTFRHDDSNPNSLGMAILETLYADDAGTIWVGGDGLDQFNPSTNIFKHYRHVPNDTSSLVNNEVHAILKDHKGRIWVGTAGGLDRLDEKTGKFFHYQREENNPKSLSSNFVWHLYEDHQGVIWIATGYPWFKKDPDDGGLNRLEPDGTFTRYMHDPNNPHSLINNKIAAIFEDSRGVFWVGTSGDGLHTMDRKTGKFERHLYNPNTPDQLSRPPLNFDINDKITFINEDSTGAIWIGTMFSGINRYNAETKKITHFILGNGVADSTSWNAFISREGELWITTQNDNLFRADPFRKSITGIPTGEVPFGFLEDKKGFLWVGTRGNGLFKFDQHNHLIHQFRHDPSDANSPLSNNVSGLFQNKEDTLWVGTEAGIQLLNTATQQFLPFHDDGNLKDSAGIGITDIFQDKQGVIWFCRWGLGLTRYNPKDNSFKHFFRDEKDSASISSDSLDHILEDRSGVLWTGGASGINRLNRETGGFSHYLAGTWVNSLYEDSEGNLWTGTQKGLFRYSPKEDKFSIFFDPQQEINAFTVGGITEDNHKNLWLASELGIIKLNPFTKETFIYGSKFGVNLNSLILWGAKAHKNREGQIFFPGEIGFYTFSPEELAIKKDFKIIITDFFVNSLPVLTGKESPLQKPIEETNELDLKYNQNNIAFNFAAIDYREPQATKYFTMLENYDNTWREARSDKNSNYFNLSPGKYVYHIKSFNVDGTKAEKIVTIFINPPWWKTWWAYSIYILLVMLGIFAIYRYQKQRIILVERQKREQFELAQAKEIEKAYVELKTTHAELKAAQAQLVQSEKMASLGELTAGIAHEIQNPLNFVNNFSDVNKELIDELREEQKKETRNPENENEILDNIEQNLEKINHHGKRADAIVKGMLQHARTTTGQKEPTDINALADEYLRLSYHGLRAKDKSFNAGMHTDFDKTTGNINIIPQDIGRVLLNLFNNAFYAVAEKKKQEEKNYHPLVSLITKRTTDKVEITVKDNGSGIPQKVLDKIFQPFFTTKPTGQGTGLGLSLSYDIIRAHGGEIKVETKESEGTSFIIRLPVD
jgi:signal transduction histidine kinase/ligand-binding sensor domain-containing protein